METICRELRLSEEHFNRVIFRARNRFRELVEHRGFRKADLLTIAAVGLCLAIAGSGGLAPAGQATEIANSSTVPLSVVTLGDSE